MLCSNSSTQLQNNLVLKLNVSSYELYQIDEYCIVQNINNLTVQGVNGNSTIRCVPVGSPGSGFGFINITNLLLANLHFDGCGGVIPSTAVRSFNNTHPHLLYKQRAVLMFNLCNNVTIRQVNIDNLYFGYAILILNPFGTFEVLNTTVSKGQGGILCSDDTTSCPGSGIAAIFKNRGKSTKENYVQVVLKETTSRENGNAISNIPAISNLRKYEACQLPVVGAAGLTVIFTQTDYVANFTATQSTIGDFNFGTVAGGMLILFLNGMEKFYAALINTNLDKGSLLANTNQIGGSGIAIHSFICGKCSSSTFESHPIYLDTVNIIGLGADRISKLQYGGTFYMDIHESCGNNFKQFLLKKVNFIRRFDHVFQPAMYAIVRPPKANNSIILESCEMIQRTKYTASSSQVAVMTFVNWKNVTICGESYFHESENPVLAVYNTNLFIQGRMKFINNSGTNGAAISLYHSSYLFLIPPLHATFLNNKALLYGGAIYAVNDPVPGDNMCVIQLGVNTSNLDNLDIMMTFINNKAGLAGNSIYAALIYNCIQYYSTDLDIRVLLNATFEPIPTDDGLQHISSVPVEICYCSISNVSDDKIQLHCTSSGTPIQVIDTYPGKSITLSIVVVDAMGLIVYSPVSASITPYHYYGPRLSQDVLTLKEGQDLVSLSVLRCSKVTYNIHSKTNQPNHGYLQLAVPGNEPSLSALIYVYPCPIGFQLSNNGICECNHFITKVITNAKCNISTLLITRPIGSWLGRINNFTFGFTNICPSGNCRSTTIAINVSDIDHSICIDGKIGVLCGQCINTLSIIFGTTKCRHCSNLWLLTLVGYAAIGVILVTVLLFLRLTLSEGPLASIILTNNIIAVSTIDYLDDDNVFISGMRIFVSLMNLNLGFPLCFYDGMTTAIKIGLQFTFPVYLWTIVIVFIVLSRYSTRVSNQTAASSVQVLATLIHLSFSKLLITSIDILIYTRVKTGNNDIITVWYKDGSVVYLQDKEHIILFSIAIVTLVLFILPYIIIVTFGNYFLRWKRLHHFRSFIESFHGPYKHTLGYWFGVRVLVVVYIYIVFTALRGVDVTLMLFLQVISMIPLLVLQGYVKPFRQNGLNRMDSFCLFVVILHIIVALLCVPVMNHTSQTLSYITVSLTAVVFCILVINISSKCLGKFKVKKCNTQFCDDRETRHSTERHMQEDDKEEYDEMRQALLILAD